MKREGGGEGRKRTSERQKEGRDWAGQRGLQGTQMRGQRKRGGRLWPGEGESARTWGRQELTETTGSWGGGPSMGEATVMKWCQLGNNVKVSSGSGEKI